MKESDLIELCVLGGWRLAVIRQSWAVLIAV